MTLDRGHGFAVTQKNKARAHSRAKGSAKLSRNSGPFWPVMFCSQLINFGKKYQTVFFNFRLLTLETHDILIIFNLINAVSFS